MQQNRSCAILATEGTDVLWNIPEQLNLCVLKILCLCLYCHCEKCLAYAVPQDEPGHSLGMNEEPCAKMVAGNSQQIKQHYHRRQLGPSYSLACICLLSYNNSEQCIKMLSGFDVLALALKRVEDD